MLELSTKVLRKTSICAVKMGEEISMLDVDSGKYFVLNSMGAVIWDFIEAPTTVSEIVVALMKEYEIQQDQCETSVLKYINDMKQSNLIEVEV